MLLKKISLAFAGIVCLSTSAFALHETNCSNATGTIKRVEREFWGRNPISWIYNGDVVWSNNFPPKDNIAQVNLLHSTKQTLSQTVDNERNDNLSSTEETYIIKVKITFKSGANKDKTFEDYVICRAWQNSALD